LAIYLYMPRLLAVGVASTILAPNFTTAGMLAILSFVQLYVAIFIIGRKWPLLPRAVQTFRLGTRAGPSIPLPCVAPLVVWMLRAETRVAALSISWSLVRRRGRTRFFV
jgi:hypothetical protein